MTRKTREEKGKRKRRVQMYSRTLLENGPGEGDEIEGVLTPFHDVMTFCRKTITLQVTALVQE